MYYRQAEHLLHLLPERYPFNAKEHNNYAIRTKETLNTDPKK